ncbi:MAG: T9SS type A sorting domain-containing protein [Candidatus Sabulitectum sp.]|nr:T9SS type A sorting domain-containing protein [Candidatus Sabulitectum sp.]
MKLFLMLLTLSGIMLGNEIYSLMNFQPSSDVQAELFNRIGFDVVQVCRDGSMDFVANSFDRRTLLENGLFATTRIADMEGYYRARNGTGRSMGGFYTWDEVDTWIDSLVAANPAITSVQSIGDTYEGRPQRVVKISVNNSFSDDNPAMANAWYDGLIHAREGASMRNIRYWMMWLCSNYQRNGYDGYQATWLLENREIWCLPVNNVDGWVYNQSISPGGGGMHRKNRNTSAGGDGVDLNRNWSVAWGGAGSSGDPGSSTYRGAGPISEPEASNIDTFWQTHIPTQMHSTHTYSNALIYPWGWTDDPTTHAAQYTTQGEMMVQWATGEEHYRSWLFGASAGNTRDHSYGLYGAMSWNHETGASFAGFWPSATEVVKLSRRNLRSYLVTACLAGCPYDPHEPGVPVVESIGSVSVPFVINWSDAADADYYALQRLSGYQLLLDDHGDSGPFDKVNWIMTSSQHHSGTQSYVSNGTGQMTWQESVTIPANGGGRISFWSEQDITPQSYQGAFSYSPDAGANWYYLQTFGRNDMTWRFNIHELDEFQGQTLMLRWESYGSSSSCKLYIDDIKIDVWDNNEIHADNIATSEYDVTVLNNGEYYFRVWAVDNDFGPGWASEPVLAQVSTAGVDQLSEGITPQVSSLGLITPNPVYTNATIPVTVAAGNLATATLVVFDVTGRRIADLTSLLSESGYRNIIWDTREIPAGVHFVRLETASGITVRRVVSAVNR